MVKHGQPLLMDYVKLELERKVDELPCFKPLLPEDC